MSRMKCEQHNDIELGMPEGYIAKNEWADKMITKGLRQIKCPDCGLFAIWLRKDEIKRKNIRITEYKCRDDKNEERDKKIKSEYKKRVVTLKELAGKYGVSSERIRQIINKK